MKARIFIAAAVVALVFASQASASVISASSQTARSKPADKVDYLSVTSIQSDLNASMREAADASAPTALGARSVPSTASGGFLLNAEPGNSARFQGIGGDAMQSLFSPDREAGVSPISRDVAGPGMIIANGSHYSRTGSYGRKWGGHGGHRKGGGGIIGGGGHDGGGGGGIQAAPEPSTWLLLCAGLTMVGLYEVVRRRS